MNKIICPKCGDEISDDFGVTLSFCTSCGASLSNVSNEKTLSFTNSSPNTAPAASRQFPMVILTSFLTACFLIVFFAGGLYFYSSQSSKETSSQKPDKTAAPSETNSKPTPREKKPSTISAFEITKVTFFSLQHSGPLYGSDESYSTANATSFSSDGTASRNLGGIHYDTGKKKATEDKKYQGAITKEQFDRLRQSIVENDFFNEEDSREYISDTTSYTLTVNSSAGDKQITTSNIEKDTPEVEAILQTFNNLQNQVDWKEIK